MATVCYVQVSGTDENKIKNSLDKALHKVYEGGIPPRGTSIQLSEWQGAPQIEIHGFGEDGRCKVCKYFIKMIGVQNTRRNNCPYPLEDILD